jgi:hypothetical protein
VGSNPKDPQVGQSLEVAGFIRLSFRSDSLDRIPAHLPTVISKVFDSLKEALIEADDRIRNVWSRILRVLDVNSCMGRITTDLITNDGMKKTVLPSSAQLQRTLELELRNKRTFCSDFWSDSVCAHFPPCIPQFLYGFGKVTSEGHTR